MRMNKTLRAGFGIAVLMMGSALAAPAIAQITNADGVEESARSIITLGGDDAGAESQPYWFTITRGEDGAVTFDGLAPDQAIRDALGADIDGADVSGVAIASGAPDLYESAVELGRQIIDRLEAGRFSVRGDMLTIRGEAASQDDADAIVALTEDIPDGLILILNEVTYAEPEKRPDNAEFNSESEQIRGTNYPFRASKTAEGIEFEGLVPTEQLAGFLAVRVGNGGVANVSIADGAPDGFIADILLALDLLDQLETGEIDYESETWSVSGMPVPDAGIEGLLGDREWALNLEAEAPNPVDPPVETSAEAAIDPNYSFSASKPETGPMTLSGMVPAEPARRYIGVIGSTDPASLEIVPGAPEGFTEEAVEGVRSLAAMQSGELEFANGNWNLSGIAGNPVSAETLTATLSAREGWRVDIAAPEGTGLCREELAAFSADNPILFASGSSQIAGSQVAIDQLVAFLGDCPEMPIYIEGHTDSDGGASANLALSVARAEAVVAALIGQGVETGRLYAVGYGESDPIASNDTTEGKQRNRRIVVTLEPR